MLTEFDQATDLWAALTRGFIAAAYTGRTEAETWIAENPDYKYMHEQAGWSESQGVAYGCRPEFGDKVALLNKGLVAFKATKEYVELCEKYSAIKCDCVADDTSTSCVQQVSALAILLGGLALHASNM
mmetsp:Transcript_48363/g.88796  ORF Transcript_48363/g.88796 Transcript_48363/m.88796 type:complete len:128 (-) Transcript_48363:20-403(-)